MSEFKFLCPSCGQKIEVDASASGRQFACPSCQSELLIPVAPKEAADVPTATLVQSYKPASKAGSGTAPASVAPKIKLSAGVPAQPEGSVDETRLEVSAPKPQAAEVTAKVAKPRIEKPGSRSSSEETPVPSAKAQKPEVKQPIQIRSAQGSDGEAPGGGVTSHRKASLQTPTKMKSGHAAAKKSVKVRVAESAAAPEQPTQVATLTPKIKRDIVLSARRRIADETHWMPRIDDQGEYTYAAKDVQGAQVPVDVDSPEATRFSVLGAVLLELHLRNVTQTATGRAQLLDDELLDAFRQVAGDAVSEQPVGPGEMQSKGKVVPPISHAQSLEALDMLANRYAQEMDSSRRGGGAGSEGLRLEDLSNKIKRKIPVSIEQLCAALTNELSEINERLCSLERNSDKNS